MTKIALCIKKEEILELTASREKLRSFHPEVDYSLFEDMEDFSYDDYVKTLLIMLSALENYERQIMSCVRLGGTLFPFLKKYKNMAPKFKEFAKIERLPKSKQNNIPSHLLSAKEEARRYVRAINCELEKIERCDEIFNTYMNMKKVAKIMYNINNNNEMYEDDAQLFHLELTNRIKFCVVSSLNVANLIRINVGKGIIV